MVVADPGSVLPLEGQPLMPNNHTPPICRDVLCPWGFWELFLFPIITIQNQYILNGHSMKMSFFFAPQNIKGKEGDRGLLAWPPESTNELCFANCANWFLNSWGLQGRLSGVKPQSVSSKWTLGYLSAWKQGEEPIFWRGITFGRSLLYWLRNRTY